MIIETRKIDLLLIEDNEDEARLTVRALASEQITNNIYWVKDGKEAKDYLHAEGEYTSRNNLERPRLILLDLDLPHVNGMDLLRMIKTNPITQMIPVVVLTSNLASNNREECYKVGANSYVIKPVSFREYLKLAKKIGYYWISVNQTVE